MGGNFGKCKIAIEYLEGLSAVGVSLASPTLGETEIVVFGPRGPGEGVAPAVPEVPSVLAPLSRLSVDLSRWM